jgi:hypothetical protein
MKARVGIEIEVVVNDVSGQVDLVVLTSTIDLRSKLIWIAHVPSHGGLINPATEIGRIDATRHGSPHVRGRQERASYQKSKMFLLYSYPAPTRISVVKPSDHPVIRAKSGNPDHFFVEAKIM